MRFLVIYLTVIVHILETYIKGPIGHIEEYEWN